MAAICVAGCAFMTGICAGGYGSSRALMTGICVADCCTCCADTWIPAHLSFIYAIQKNAFRRPQSPDSAGEMQRFTIFQMKEPERILHMNPAKILRAAGDLRERTVHDAALHGGKFISDQAVADRQPRAAAAVRQPPFRTMYILRITPVDFFMQKIRHFSGLFSQSRHVADSRTVDLRFHRGKYMMADAVADGVVLRIGGILTPTYALAPERRFDLLP